MTINKEEYDKVLLDHTANGNSLLFIYFQDNKGNLKSITISQKIENLESFWPFYIGKIMHEIKKELEKNAIN